MKTLLSYPDRRFRLWAYVPTHSNLLIRSGKETSGTTRIDIAFNGVSVVNLPVLMEGLTIERPDPRSARTMDVAGGLDGFSARRLLIVRGVGYEGHIVALKFETDESDKRFPERDKWGIASPDGWL
ncbi:hypothetical protein AB0G15_36215 [Streptosporangium sp. NPDC023825]|uniref:hypothetical protein n=1 Tax=Streptosporangium sp. NPDC023825 TaxID=3154909 RepID=UPI003441C00C